MKKLIPAAFLLLSCTASSSEADHISLPLPIADVLVVSCAEILTAQNTKDGRWTVTCLDVQGKNRTFIFRLDAAGYLYLEQ